MSRKTIAEIIDNICKINEQLEENRKAYEPYVGRRLDSFSVGEAEALRKLAIVSQQLVNAKAELRNEALYEHGVFVT